MALIGTCLSEACKFMLNDPREMKHCYRCLTLFRFIPNALFLSFLNLLSFHYKRHNLSQWVSNFHEPWPPSKFNWRILNISWHLGYAMSRQSYLVKASARGTRSTAPWPPRGLRAPFEKLWSKQSEQHRIKWTKAETS